MSAEVVQAAGRCVAGSVGASRAAIRALRRHWNKRKCVASDHRFSRAKELIRKLSEAWALASPVC